MSYNDMKIEGFSIKIKYHYESSSDWWYVITWEVFNRN